VSGAGGAIWARLDARAGEGIAPEIGPRTRLAGLTLLMRHLRMAARLGWAGVAIVVDGADERAELEAALASEPSPPPLAVTIVDAGAPARDRQDVARHVPLLLRAVYARDALVAAADAETAPAPLAEIRQPEDLGAAEAALVRGLRKTVSHDGVVAYYVMRPISRLLARALVDTRVTPNQITLLALACGVAGGVLIGTGGADRAALGGLLVWTAGVIDCVDGDLARLRIEGSRLGQWLDTLADDLTTFGLLAGLGAGLYRDGAGPLWLWVGGVGALLWAVTEGKLYADIHRLGLPVDTAQYPWFFGDPSRAPAPGAGLASRLMNAAGFLFKRDATLTAIALLLLFDHRRPALAMLAAGSAVMFVLLLVQLAVTDSARRPR
jgi:hypothetical protein